MNLFKFVAASVVALGLGTSAGAVPISVFGTGFGSDGSLLPAGSLDEANYTLTDVNGAQEILVGTDLGGPGGVGQVPAPWVDDNSTSRWIGPNTEDQDFVVPGGQFTYTTTFDLTGLIADTAQLTGQVTSDNGVEIFLNGLSVFIGGASRASPGSTSQLGFRTA
ncbi:MAG: hypothetical protein ACFBSD_13870 [Paracoccaceae bacterium]